MKSYTGNYNEYDIHFSDHYEKCISDYIDIKVEEHIDVIISNFSWLEDLVLELQRENEDKKIVCKKIVMKIDEKKEFKNEVKNKTILYSLSTTEKIKTSLKTISNYLVSDESLKNVKTCKLDEILIKSEMKENLKKDIKKQMSDDISAVQGSTSHTGDAYKKLIIKLSDVNGLIQVISYTKFNHANGFYLKGSSELGVEATINTQEGRLIYNPELHLQKISVTKNDSINENYEALRVTNKILVDSAEVLDLERISSIVDPGIQPAGEGELFLLVNDTLDYQIV